MKLYKYVLPVVLSSTSLFGITASWTPAGGGSWNTGTNWTGGVAPVNVDDNAQLLNTIAAPSTITIGTPISLGSLLFNNGAQPYTVDASTLTFQTTAGNATVSVAAAGGSHTISSAVSLASPLTINQSGTLLTISGVISGTQAVTYAGPNNATIAGTAANTYTGLTTVTGGNLTLNNTGGAASAGDYTITGGTLTLGSANQVSSTATVTLDGGTFDMATFADTLGGLNVRSITLSNPPAAVALANNAPNAAFTVVGGLGVFGTPLTLSGSGSVVFDDSLAGQATISGTIDLGTSVHNFSIPSGGTAPQLTVSGIMSNTGGINKTGAGTLELTASNTYSGNTVVTAGTLNMNSAAPCISSNNVVVNGGTLSYAQPDQIANASTVTVNGGTLDFVAGGNTDTFTQLVYNGGNVNLAGTTLSLTGATALQMRNTTLDNGTVSVAANSGVVFDASNNGTAVLGTVANPFTLDLNGGNSIFTVNNGSTDPDMVIQGQGTLTNGTLTLAGTGTLQFNSSQNQALTAINVNSGELSLNQTVINTISANVTINGGLVSYAASDQINTGNTVTVAGGTYSLGAFNDTIAALIMTSGTASTTSGVLTLNASPALLMGPGTSFNGNIVLGTSGDVIFSGVSGTATLDGTLDLGPGGAVNFNIPGAGVMDVNNVITNTSSLDKTNTGTLILTGANTYSGGTNLNGGTLQGNTTSLQGAITTAGGTNLIFDQNFDGSFGGGTDVITGTGSLIKNGTGNVTLTGTQTVSPGGTVAVNAGTLTVNGTLDGNSTMSVLGGATLAGVGTINHDLTLFGTLSSGDNSIGTITINGNNTFESGSTLDIEVTPTVSDMVVMNPGQLNIVNGAIFNFTPQPGTYTPTTYTVITTTGGVTGQFIVTDPFPLFEGTLLYPGNDVLLQLFLLPVSSLPGLSGNGAKVANCLDSLNPTVGTDLYDVINSLRFVPSVESLLKSLDSMQPSLFVALSVVKESSTLDLRNTIYNRLDSRGRSCMDDEKGYHFWVGPFLGLSYEKNHSSGPGYDALSPGVVVGMDGFLIPQLQVGGSVAYSHSYVDYNSNRGSATINNIYGSLYGRFGGQFGYLEGVGTFGYGYYSTLRKIRIGGEIPLHRTAKGNHHGVEGAVHVKGGGLLPVKQARIGPYGAIDYLYTYENSFDESGASSLNLKVGNRHANLIQTELGIELSQCINLRRQSLNPFINVSGIWEKRFGNGKLDSAFTQGCSYEVFGYFPSSRLLVGAGAGFNIEWALKTAPKAAFSYKGKYGHGYQNHSINLEIIY